MKILYILSAIRIHNTIIGMLSGYIAAIILNPSMQITSISILLLEIFFLMAFGNLINDLQDISTDKIAHPKRSLVSGKISIKESKIILCVLLLCIIFISITLSLKLNVFLYFIILPLLIFYNKIFKPIPILGNIVIAFLLCSIFIFTEIFLLDNFKVLYFPTILIFCFSFLREFIKDIEDYHGDRMIGINTFPVLIGEKASILIAVFLIIFFGLFLFVPYYLNYFNIIYLYSVIILIEIPLIIMVFLLLNNPCNRSFKHIAFLTKAMSFSGLLIFFILYK